MKCRTIDPIHEDEGKWWFWDETWTDRHGPYPTRERAKSALDYYVQVYLEGKSPFLCYYELHVDSETFYIHVIIMAKNEDEAFEKLESKHGKHYHLQAKGVLGKIEHPGTSILQFLGHLAEI